MRPLRSLAVFALCLVFAAGLIGVSAASRAEAQQPQAHNDSGVYRLGPGDKVRVTTFGETSLTGDFTVGPAGRVSLPLVGDIAATGLTSSEFQAAVETALRSGFLRDPKVSVEVITYRPFYILGEVQRPGEYPYTSALTVQRAVATANGFTYRANTKKVYIKHANSDEEKSYPLTVSTPVSPGDTIRIVERFF
jgi:protein involved in polysaccharide export with SLBB domain